MSDSIDSAALRRMAKRSSIDGGGGAGGPRVLFGNRAMRRLSKIGGMMAGGKTWVWIVLWRNLFVQLELRVSFDAVRHDQKKQKISG